MSAPLQDQTLPQSNPYQEATDGVFGDDVGVRLLSVSFHSSAGADLMKKLLHSILKQPVNQGLQQRELGSVFLFIANVVLFYCSVMQVKIVRIHINT